MTDEQENIMDDFVAYEKSRGLSNIGLRGTSGRIPRFFDYLNEKGLNVYDVKIPEALEYQRWLIKKGQKKDGKKYSNGTVIGLMQTVTNLYSFLKVNKKVCANPFLDIRKVRSDVTVPRNVLKEKELFMLLEELSCYDKYDGNLKSKITAYKVHVASEIMYATGLRSTEVACLKVDDIDFDNGMIRVKNGKGGVERQVFVNDYTKRILQLYVTEMKDTVSNVWNKKSDSLFGMGYERFNKIINEVLKKTCTKLKLPLFSSHCFRHSLGYHLLKRGCDIRYIQALLGHKRLSSTEIYTKIDKEDLKEVLNKYHPRNFKRISKKR